MSVVIISKFNNVKATINTHLSLMHMELLLLQNNKRENLKFTVKRIIFLLNPNAKQDTSFTLLPGAPFPSLLLFFCFLY